jgi:hypothetical protein
LYAPNGDLAVVVEQRLAEGANRRPGFSGADQKQFDRKRRPLGPVGLTDPTGRGCTSQADTARGKTINTNDVTVQGPSCAEIDEADQKLKPAVTVTEQRGSTLDYLMAGSVPRYVANDVALDNKGRIVAQELSSRIDNYPAVCAAGITVRIGRENSWFSLGFDLNSAKGVRGAGGVRVGNSPGIGQASGSIKGFDIKASLQFPAPLGANIGVSFINHHSISTLSVGRNIGIANFQANADLGKVGQCRQ